MLALHQVGFAASDGVWPYRSAVPGRFSNLGDFRRVGYSIAQGEVREPEVANYAWWDQPTD